MAEPFKNLINDELIRTCGQHLQRAWPRFPRARFEAQALAGLGALELKARAMHVADALGEALPADFAAAADVIEAALAPVPDTEDLGSLRTSDAGLAGWIVWPLGELVARSGQRSPERALKALHALTQRFSAEFAIRPFLIHHPELTFATLLTWTRDPSAHVRCLVSEGSRPRLPWGQRLNALIADPSPTRPLLVALQDDPSEYVRRSVANHLNDIAKDHPEYVADWLERFLPDAPPERAALLRHASRSLIKAGHPRILTLLGTGQAFAGSAHLSVDPPHLRLGEEVTLSLSLTSRAAAPQKLVIDYAVHHPGARGVRPPKVYKGWKVTLQAGQTTTLQRRHSLRKVTTRTYYAGRHAVDIRINGQLVASSAFDLKASSRTMSLLR